MYNVQAVSVCLATQIVCISYLNFKTLSKCKICLSNISYLTKKAEMFSRMYSTRFLSNLYANRI